MKYFITIVLISIGFCVSAQKSLKKANRAYDKLEYYEAIDHYLKYLDKNEDNNAKVKLADCYLRTNQYQEVVGVYKTIESDLDNEGNSRLKYGNTLLILGRVAEAKKQAEKYLQMNKGNSDGLLLLKSCNQMNQFTSNENNFDVSQSDFISGTSNFSPVYYKDQLVFTSDKGGKVDKWTGRSYSNIYSYDPSS